LTRRANGSRCSASRRDCGRGAYQPSPSPDRPRDDPHPFLRQPIQLAHQPVYPTAGGLDLALVRANGSYLAAGMAAAFLWCSANIRCSPRPCALRAFQLDASGKGAIKRILLVSVGRFRFYTQLSSPSESFYLSNQYRQVESGETHLWRGDPMMFDVWWNMFVVRMCRGQT